MMLGAYMEDLNLQPEDLESALAQVKPSIRSAALQVVLKIEVQTERTPHVIDFDL